MTVNDPVAEFDIEIPYVKRNSDGELPNHAQMFSWEPEFMDMQPGKVRDMRSASATQTKGFSIGSSGFDYARLEDGELPEIEDWTDQEQVKEKYFPKLEALIKERLGATEVRAFHHIVRNTNYEEGMGYTRKHRCPARRPHVDVTAKFAPILLSWDCPDIHKEVHEGEGRHWQMVNAWRPLKTIRKSPVTVAHTGSMKWEDYLVVPQPEVGPGTEGYWLQRPQDPDRKHDWWFMSDQTPNDVLLFLQHDSKGAQVVGHTSFHLPGEMPPEPRESIEVRLFVVY